jgi:hypothetical protein
LGSWQAYIGDAKLSEITLFVSKLEMYHWQQILLVVFFEVVEPTFLIS